MFSSPSCPSRAWQASCLHGLTSFACSRPCILRIPRVFAAPRPSRLRGLALLAFLAALRSSRPLRLRGIASLTSSRPRAPHVLRGLAFFASFASSWPCVPRVFAASRSLRSSRLRVLCVLPGLQGRRVFLAPRSSRLHDLRSRCVFAALRSSHDCGLRIPRVFVAPRSLHCVLRVFTAGGLRREIILIFVAIVSLRPPWPSTGVAACPSHSAHRLPSGRTAIRPRQWATAARSTKRGFFAAGSGVSHMQTSFLSEVGLATRTSFLYDAAYIDPRPAYFYHCVELTLQIGIILHAAIFEHAMTVPVLNDLISLTNE